MVGFRQQGLDLRYVLPWKRYITFNDTRPHHAVFTFSICHSSHHHLQTDEIVMYGVIFTKQAIGRSI